MTLPSSYSWFIVPPSVSAGRGIIGAAGGRATGFGKNGIAVPVSGDGRGRLAFVSGEEQLSKLLMLNLMDLESDNPFQQDLGLGGAMIFALNIDALQSELRRRINAIFRRFQLQDRARLAKPVQFNVISAEQELEALISYINLEENKPNDVNLKFSRANSASVASALVSTLGR